MKKSLSLQNNLLENNTTEIRWNTVHANDQRADTTDVFGVSSPPHIRWRYFGDEKVVYSGSTVEPKSYGRENR